MRRITLAAAALAVVLGVAPVLAHGPSGSSEDRNGEYTNDVRCGAGTETPAATVYAGANGAEICNDGTTVPVQGRIIVSAEGQYISADGDEDNHEEARGWLRIDSNGVRCGDAGGRLDSTHPTSADNSADCGS